MDHLTSIVSGPILVALFYVAVGVWGACVFTWIAGAWQDRKDARNGPYLDPVILAGIEGRRIGRQAAESDTDKRYSCPKCSGPVFDTLDGVIRSTGPDNPFTSFRT